MADKEIGKVTHFFDKINVAVLSLNGKIQVGDKLHFMGHSSDFEQEVDSLQIDHEPVKAAKKGDNVAIKVAQPVHPNDKVIKVK
jgi:putative protease